MHLRRPHLLAALLFLLAAVGGYFYFIYGLPSIESLDDYRPNVVSRAYSHDGRPIAEFYVEKRVVVPFEKMPPHLIKAFLAAEDSKFYEHEGISYTGIMRAMFKNLLAGRVVQGGSTITQQLAKSFFLTPERTLSRKVREFIMAYRIEKHLTKEEILNLYLNQIYFGNGAYGVQTASEAYFGKDVNEIDLAEAALLAGLPKAPSKYSPFANFDLSKKRQEFILSRMLEEGFINPEEAQRAAARKIRLMPKRVESLNVGPYFNEHLRKYLLDKYGEDALYRQGLEIYTTLDVEAQKAANAAVTAGLTEYDRRRGYRGPINHLISQEEMDAFLREADKRHQNDPVDAGKSFDGIITQVNPRGSLVVALGTGTRGVINPGDLEWARLFNPSGTPDGGKITEPRNVFHSGDVVRVKVRSMPNNPALPLQLELEQEPKVQAALLAMEPETGSIRAMVGGYDFARSQFNRTVQALRQPGSSFKPIIYTAAIDKGYTPASIVMDTPVVYTGVKDEEWRPKNYDDQFFGPTTLREALARSRNIVTVKILQDIGVDYATSYARLLGINSPLARDLSVSLGSSAVTVLEMTTAFSTLAALGSRPEPLFITKVTDRAGKVLEANRPYSTPVLSPQTAYIMTSLMQSVIEQGTGMRARALGRPAAGKTGTTNNLNDAWFVGYVPGLVAAAWVGYDNEQQLGRGETGARAALPIWLKFMQGATASRPVRSFQMPEGLEFARIDPETGLLAGPGTREPVFEVFKVGTTPTEVSSPQTKQASGDFFMMDTDSRPVRRKLDETEAVD